jgi:hypothetical protein
MLTTLNMTCERQDALLDVPLLAAFLAHSPLLSHLTLVGLHFRRCSRNLLSNVSVLETRDDSTPIDFANLFAACCNVVDFTCRKKKEGRATDLMSASAVASMAALMPSSITTLNIVEHLGQKPALSTIDALDGLLARLTDLRSESRMALQLQVDQQRAARRDANK